MVTAQGGCEYCHEFAGWQRLCDDCQARVDWFAALTPEEQAAEEAAMVQGQVSGP